MHKNCDRIARSGNSAGGEVGEFGLAAAIITVPEFSATMYYQSSFELPVSTVAQHRETPEYNNRNPDHQYHPWIHKHKQSPRSEYARSRVRLVVHPGGLEPIELILPSPRSICIGIHNFRLRRSLD